MDNYICIDGVKVLLNDSQVEELRATLQKEAPNNIAKCFERVPYCEPYYYISDLGIIDTEKDYNVIMDRARYDSANYCTDENILKKRELDERLNRLLWRYSMRHEGDKIDWSERNQGKFFIYFDLVDTTFVTRSGFTYQYILGIPYFYTYAIADKAIREVVLPFITKYPYYLDYLQGKDKEDTNN